MIYTLVSKQMILDNLLLPMNLNNFKESFVVEPVLVLDILPLFFKNTWADGSATKDVYSIRQLLCSWSSNLTVPNVSEIPLEVVHSSFNISLNQIQRNLTNQNSSENLPVCLFFPVSFFEASTFL